MRRRGRIGYVVGMVYLVGIVLLISLAGEARAASEGDAKYNVYYGTGTGAGLSGNGGENNAFLGYSAGHGTNTGDFNTFIGYMAGIANTSGYDNTFIGQVAGFQNIAGHNNTYIGANAGEANTGSGNVFIGFMAGANETSSSNLLYIDNSNTSTPLIKGDFSAGTVTIYGTLTTASDERLKKNIKPLDAALKHIMSLQGVSYEWKEEFIKGKSIGNKQIGLIAQEVEKVMPELVHTDSNGYKSVAYDKIAPVLVEAFKEQQRLIKDLQGKNEKLEKRLLVLEKGK